LIEDFARRNNEFFWITAEERARIAQQKLYDIIVEDKVGTQGHTADSLKESILTTFVNDPYSYTPQKTFNEIKSYTDKIQNITTTSVGKRLKQLAKLY